MDTLKSVLARYVGISKRLMDINGQAKDARDDRRSIEMDLIAVYNESAHTLPDKIDLDKSKMVFIVKKPGQWKKGWGLSKKQLEVYLKDILPEHGEDVMKEIVRRHERTLIADEYSFELKAMGEQTE